MAASPLVYPTGDFQPFTKILSAEVNGKFNAITTLLNVTKLSDTNVQQNGLSLSRLTVGTSFTAVYYDTTGQPTAGILPLLAGGTGLAIVPASQSPGDVLQINNAGTALIVGAPTAVPAPARIFNFYRFV